MVNRREIGFPLEILLPVGQPRTRWLDYIEESFGISFERVVGCVIDPKSVVVYSGNAASLTLKEKRVKKRKIIYV